MIRLVSKHVTLMAVCLVAAIALSETLLLPYQVDTQVGARLTEVRNDLQRLLVVEAAQDRVLLAQYAEILNLADPDHVFFSTDASTEASASELLKLYPSEPSSTLAASIKLPSLRATITADLRKHNLGYLAALFVGLLLAGLRRSLSEQPKEEVESGSAGKTDVPMMVGRSNDALASCHELAQFGCWEWCAHSGMFWCSPSLATVMRNTFAEQVDQETFFQSLYPRDRAMMLKAAQAMLHEGSEGEIDFRVSTASGECRHIHLVSRVLHDDEQRVVKVVGTCQDITERKAVEARLRKLSSAIVQSGSSIMIIDILGAIEYVNPKYSEVTGFALEEVEGKQPDLLSRKWLNSERYELLWNTIMSGNNWRGELQNRNKDGSLFWSLASISPVYSEYDELTHFVIVCEDVTELKDAHARMERLALYDELTELPNRRLFFKELAELFDPTTETSTAAVMLLDLDFFKAINDTQGHGTGDQLLVEVAERLVSCIGEGDTAARLGGDEFAILIRNAHNVHHIETVAEAVLDAIAKPYYINSYDIQISTSLGVAWLPKHADTPESLLKYADLAMYQAKEKGRNQYRFFNENLHCQLQTYVQFSREMPRALYAGEFILQYQPQLDLTSSRVVSVEALLRWEHPNKGLVSPDAFISVAEETGFIVSLGRWVLEEACLTIREMAALGFDDVRIAINLSSRQFRDPQLLSMIQQTIAEFEINPANLELEITESLLMQDVEAAIETLRALQHLGVTVAIDDFGIGYSSFNYLKMLPVDVLKIDREFIKDIPDHQDDMEITAAIISMAHRLSMRVVAEGIETKAQHQFLAEQSCDVGQGFLFSQPLNFPELLSFLCRELGEE